MTRAAPASSNFKVGNCDLWFEVHVKALRVGFTRMKKSKAYRRVLCFVQVAVRHLPNL